MGISVYLVNAGTEKDVEGIEGLNMGYGTFDLLVQAIYWNVGGWTREQVQGMKVAPTEYPGLLAFERMGRTGTGRWTTQECEAILELVNKALNKTPAPSEEMKQHVKEARQSLAAALFGRNEDDENQEDEADGPYVILQIPPWFVWQHTRRGNWDESAADLAALLQAAVDGKHDIVAG